MATKMADEQKMETVLETANGGQSPVDPDVSEIDAPSDEKSTDAVSDVQPQPVADEEATNDGAPTHSSTLNDIAEAPTEEPLAELRDSPPENGAVDNDLQVQESATNVLPIEEQGENKAEEMQETQDEEHISEDTLLEEGNGVADEAESAKVSAESIELDLSERLEPEPQPQVGEIDGEHQEEDVEEDTAIPEFGDIDQDFTPLVPGTPIDHDHDQGSGIKEPEPAEVQLMEEMEDKDAPVMDREQLIAQYQVAVSDREQQLQQNFQLQHKLADYFRKKKSEETRQELDKNLSDSEQRYVKYLTQLDYLRSQDSVERETYKVQIEEMKEKCQMKQVLVENDQGRFMEYQKQVALNSLNSRSGKPIPPKDIEQYLIIEARKEAEVVSVRLEYIKLKNRLKKKEQLLKSKEELAEGLHLIDFEQLKIENQTYNEKIEERNEDLLKLRKKITSTVQVLTHLKEKLQFVHAENQILKANLYQVEEEAAKKRDKLTRTKQARDHLRIDNQRLRQNSGLLGNEPLLRDFEQQTDQSSDLNEKLENLKMQHAELTLSCTGVRKKIEQVRYGRG